MIKGNHWDKFTEECFLEFAQKVSYIVFNQAREFYDVRLVNNVAKIDYYGTNIDNTKAEHKIDKIVKDVIREYINDNYPHLWDIANVHMEDMETSNCYSKKISLFFDPVDGSRSADVNIGDPCFMIAYAEKNDDCKEIRFKDLKSCFIKCLKTGDIYFTYNAKGYYIPNGHTYELLPNGSALMDGTRNVKALYAGKNEKFELAHSTVVIRDGYGMRKIVAEKINHDILNDVKHTFSYDITGTELCYLAAGRDIIHVLVEARKHKAKDQRWVGSDGFNLIPYPLLKASGAMIYSLDGVELEDVVYNPRGIYDFIACSSKFLVDKFIEKGVKEVL
jgi:fructose-1,6-bisphosphatase/inositol monophosphatase family enzyme